MVKAPVLALAFSLINTTGDVDEKGVSTQRTTYPAKHYKGFTSLKSRLLKCIEITVQEGDTARTMSLDEYQKCDPKPAVTQERFVDSDLELLDSEKKALECAIAERDQLPVVDEETVAGLKELGIEYGK